MFKKYLSILSLTVLIASAATQGHAQTKQPHVVIDTKYGSIEIELLPYIAPGHVVNFIKLAQAEFYDGTIFHRVIPGFMIQGGDPNTKGNNKQTYGAGGPGYTIKAEFNNQPHIRGTVSMARSQDPNSAGSQFYIVTSDSRFLDKKYTVFGRVTHGMEVADKIVRAKRDGNDLPHERIEMKVRVVDPSVLNKIGK
jgi:peptidyl-prolyl cis-trans isomerase B (cyclophilin B)